MNELNLNQLTYIKKYHFLKHNLFNYWSLLYYNKYIYYFFNFFFKRGKKMYSIKLIYLLLYHLKKKTNLPPILVLQSALLNYRHVLKLKVLKYRRRKVYSYVLLSLHKQVRVSVKYVADQFSKFSKGFGKKYSLIEKLTIFVLNMFFKTPIIYGRYLKDSSHIHKVIQEKQPRGSKNRRSKRKIKAKKKGNKGKRGNKIKKGITRFRFRRKRKFNIFKVRKMKVRKYNEYKLNLWSLYNDFNSPFDLSIISDIDTTRIRQRKNKLYSTRFKYPLPYVKFLFYVILGRSYRLLENGYNEYHTTIWHNYVLRSTKLDYFFASDKSKYNVKKLDFSEQDQNKKQSDTGNDNESKKREREIFFKQLEIFLRHQYSKRNTLGNYDFINENDINSIYYRYNLNDYSSIKKLLLSSKKKNSINKYNRRFKVKEFNKAKSKSKKRIFKKDNPFNLFKSLSKKKKRKVLKTDITFFLKSLRLIIQRSCISKPRRRLTRMLVRFVYMIRRVFYLLIRFKLMKIVWLTMRAFYFKRFSGIRKKRTSLARNQVIHYIK